MIDKLRKFFFVKDEGKLRLDIQALRALAIISVIIYHLFPSRLSGGFMGVDIFFVISGYLMTVSLIKSLGKFKEQNQTSKGLKKFKNSLGFLCNFYAKRIKRLAPAACICLLLILGTVFAFGNLNITKDTSEQVFHAATFTENIFLANQSIDYLGSDKADTAVQHFWSLSVEEQFYMIWPVLLLITTLIGFSICKKNRVNLLARIRKKITKSDYWLSALTIILFTIIFFIWGYQLTKSDPAFAYFWTPARIWELALGGIICFLPTLNSKLKWHKELGLLLPWLGVTLCAYSLYKLDGVNFPGWHALIPTIGTALIIYGGTIAKKFKFSVNNLAKIRPIQFIGNISYSMYLYYTPILIFLPLFLNIDLRFSLKLKILSFLVMILFGWLSYRFIETPTRKLKWKTSTIIISGIILGCLTVGGSLGLKVYTESTINNKTSELYSDVLDENKKCLGYKSVVNKCEKSWGEFSSVNSQIWANGKNIENQNKIEEGSFRTTSSTPRLKPNGYIEFGDLNSSNIILTFGDSKINQYKDMFNQIGIKHKIKIIHMFSQCKGNYWLGYGENPYCVKRGEFVIDFIKNNHIKNVFIGTHWQYSHNNEKYEINNQFKKLTKTGATVYLLQDNPNFSDVGILDNSCMDKSCVVPKEQPIKDANSLYNLLLPETKNKIKYIKMEQFFCDNKYCYSQIGELPVFLGDQSSKNLYHVNGIYALSFHEQFYDQIKADLK